MYHWKDNQKLQIESAGVIPGSDTAHKFMRAYAERVMGGGSKNDIDTEFDSEFNKRCVCDQCFQSKKCCSCPGERTFGLKIPSFERKYSENTFLGNFMVYIVEHMGFLGTLQIRPRRHLRVECLFSSSCACTNQERPGFVSARLFRRSRSLGKIVAP